MSTNNVHVVSPTYSCSFRLAQIKLLARNWYMAVHQSFETTDWESTRCAFIYLFSPKKWLSKGRLVSHLAKSLVQMIMQHANRIMSIAQGIVNFAIMPLKKHSVLNLPNRQAKFFGGFNYRSTPRQISNSSLIHMDQPKAMVLSSSDKVNSVKTSIKTSILLAASRQGFTYCTWCVSSKMYIRRYKIRNLCKDINRNYNQSRNVKTNRK